MKQFVLTILFTSVMVLVNAQGSNEIEMADAMRASGKIYVVVGVVFVIFLGLFLYLIRIDRKITKMEKEIYNKV